MASPEETERRPLQPTPQTRAVGQLSFSPATQTTVVTTTTTTTTAFPPFTLNAPKELGARDPELYPLATIPTPAWLKKITFPMGDQMAHFEEADDAQNKLQEYRIQQQALSSKNGMLRSVRSSKENRPLLRGGGSSHGPRRSRTARSARELEDLRKQSVTPISMSDEGAASDPEAVELDSFHLQHRYEAPPLDPRTQVRPRRSPELRSPFPHDQRADPTLHGPKSFASLSPQSPADQDESHLTSLHRQSHDRHVESTPVNQDTEDELECTTAETSIKPRALGSIDISSVQDASLPSPSLSPITAAAHYGRDLPSNRPAGREMEMTKESRIFDETTWARPPVPRRSPGQSNSYVSAGAHDDTAKLDTSPLSDLPRILDSFDVMPENIQSYVMHQLLRRCSKKTLHYVAEAVAPALKVDFFKRLPPELRQNIVANLDVLSMCRAAQVSRHWRRVVDHDEKAWMHLIDAGNLIVPAGEVQRAVREGWGWQFPRPGHEWETDLSGTRVSRTMSREDLDDESILREPKHFGETDVSSNKRKRKDHSAGAHNKKLKRRESRSGDSRSTWSLDEITRNSGPNAQARHAEMIVPDPRIGLRSLSQLTLYKSIYRRHHRMRWAWLKPDSRPKHIAFRAHEGHVITCLQFDSDKILTGSDDAIIDIYDTATGAQRRRLTGHDGGVWALEYQDNILVSGSTDRSVRIWDMDTGKCLHIFQGHTSTVRCLQIIQPVEVGTKADGRPLMLPAQRTIITGSRDSTCRVWKLPTGKPTERSVWQNGPTNNEDNPFFLRALIGHTHSVRAIAAYADVLVSGSYDNTVRVWQISTGETRHTLRGHSTKVYSVVLDHERQRCISGSMDTIVKVWSIETGECLFNLNGHNSLVGLLDLKDNVLVSAAADWTLKVWDPENGRNLHTLKAHSSAITCFAHDGYKVVSGSEKSLKMWSTQTGECVRDLLTDLRGVWQVRFDERRCIAAVHRGDWTYIEVLDFGAAADGIPDHDRGRRIVVDYKGRERNEDDEDLEEVEEGDEHEVVELDD